MDIPKLQFLAMEALVSNMHKLLLPAMLILSSCGVTADPVQQISSSPAIIQQNPMVVGLHQIPGPAGPRMTIGVYGFTDKTGQRKPSDTVSSLSSAVTQGAEVWVIDALMQAGNGSWFDVLERTSIDNIVKERQLIRSTRENYEETPDTLEPMQFAGLLIEGGIVGYDSNVVSGGAGARYLGIGAHNEYRVDTVTVVLRLVSVTSGKILLSIATEKSIASQRSGADVFKFLDLGTQALEIETGYAANEPVNYAVRAAIEAGIIEMIYEGERKGLWRFKN
jgi:curli production assembly/transport component CsgG